MKKVLILSDTHLKTVNYKLSKVLDKYLKEVDFIIHAGDFVSYEVYQELAKAKKLYAVYGNNDKKQVKKHLKDKEIIKIENITIGLIHGKGIFRKIKTSVKYALEKFQEEKVDIIIFGHSHKAFMKKIKEITFFNPGSPTSKRLEANYSLGILIINGNDFTLKHHFYK